MSPWIILLFAAAIVEGVLIQLAGLPSSYAMIAGVFLIIAFVCGRYE